MSVGLLPKTLSAGAQLIVDLAWEIHPARLMSCSGHGLEPKWPQVLPAAAFPGAPVQVEAHHHRQHKDPELRPLKG